MASITAAVLLLATFAEALAAVRAIPRKRFYCPEGNLRDPHNVVCRAIRNGGDAEAATAEIARELAINHESASAIGAAITPTFGQNRLVTTAQYDAAYTELAAALKREQKQLPILTAMAQLAGRSDPFESAKDRFRALLPLVRAQPDPTGAAIELSKAAGHPDAATILLADAFARDRDNAELIDAIGGTSFDGLVRSAFGPIELTKQGATMRKRKTPLPVETLYERARLQLHTLAEFGFAGMMVSGFEALPPEVQERIVHPSPSAAHWDIRPDLAAAAILAGKPELARRVSEAITPPPKGRPDRHAGTRALIANALSDEKENPFDLIVGMFSGGTTEFTGGVRGPLFVSMLEENGYGRLAEQVRRDVQRRFAHKRDDLPPQYAPHVQRLTTRLDSMYPPREAAPPNKLLAAPRVTDAAVDSDGDGLTDAAEERLVTDPRDPDTDRDGTRDAEDTLPQVAFRSALGIEDEILAAVFEQFEPSGNVFVGDPTTFAPLTMPARSVVLTNDELLAYNKKFGEVHPMHIPKFVIDHSGNRAIVEVAQRMEGRTYLVTRTENGWEAKRIAGWVS